MRRAARTDANHQDVAGAFAELGCSVRSLAAVGGGVPDLLVGIAGRNLLVEVKDGKKSPSRRALTPDQVRFKQEWQGLILYVDDAKDVPGIVRALRQA